MSLRCRRRASTRISSTRATFATRSGQSAALQFLARGLPDAVLAANDESAIGVLMALRQAGVRVPDEVSIAGIGNTRVSQLVDLTTVSVALYETGAEAARRILGRGEWQPDARTILPHRLVVRGTTGRRAATGTTVARPRVGSAGRLDPSAPRS